MGNSQQEQPQTREDLIERAHAREALEKRLFAKDPWYGIEKKLVFTQDEHADLLGGEKATKLFPPKEYLKLISHIVMGSPTGLLMKSRQLMMSWLFCYLLLWEAITKSGRLCVAQGKREEDVLAKGDKGLMGRIRFMRRNLPEHLQPVVLEEAKGTEVYGNGSTIMAIPQGDDIVRSITASFVFMDELEFHPEGERAWTAALPTTKGGGRLWGVTTPNGQGFCYQQHDERLKWEDWEKWPEAMPGLYGYRNTKGMQLIALHYTADPEKRTPEYQVKAREGYTNMNMYRQENELDFSIVAGDGVFDEEFRKELHVLKENYKVNPTMPIYRGWDFGYNGQAVSFFQHNVRGQLVWFDQVFFRRVGLHKVIQEVLKRTTWHLGQYDKDGTKEKKLVEVPLMDLEGRPIPGARLVTPRNVAVDVQDFGDPSAEAKNTKGDTDRALLATFGIMLKTKETTGRKMDLVEQVRALLWPRSDGTPALLISPGPFNEMKMVVSGFTGGYHYPEKRAGRADKMLPHKDGVYDHIFDSAQYAIDWVQPIRAAMVEDLPLDGGRPWWRAPESDDNPWGKDFYDDLPYKPESVN